jgi:hypothetical protein
VAGLSSDIKRKNSENDLRLTVNLAEMFNLAFFPDDDGLRQAIGQAIIDQIVKNTEASEFLSGSSKKGYSKEYAESDEGIIYGKKKGKPANLHASGDMLNSITVELTSNRSKLDIAFTDTLESQKAHGHVNGSEVLPKRDFFGLSQGDLSKIAKKFDNAVSDAFALTLVNQTVDQGDQTNLDFISKLLEENG